MKLQRKWARVRRAAGLVLLVTVAVLLLPLSGWLLTADFAVMAGACGVIAVVSWRYLRCTGCKKTVAPMPLWDSEKRYHCPRCGQPFVYDDEPDPADGK